LHASTRLRSRGSTSTRGGKDTIALLGSEIGQSCAVDLDLGDLPPVTCYASRIHHVFLNVIRNAAQAVGDHGKIRIATRRSSDSATVAVIVEDEGGRVRAGLGLATSLQILHDHRGELRVESEHGKGTRVTIVLPIETSRPA
jgi:signal transduction histidine kinase